MAFALFMLGTYYTLTIIIFFGTCHDNYWDGGTGTACYMASHEYIYFKGTWAAGVAAFVYPLIFVAAHNRKFLPTEAYEAYLMFAKTRAEQEESINNTLTGDNPLPTAKQFAGTLVANV